MASVIQSLFGGKSFRLIDYKTGPVSLSGLSVIDVQIKFNGKLFKNQTETGGFIVDGKIKLPITIDITCIVQTTAGAETLNRILKDRTTIYTIRSRGLTVDNLLCANEQISMSPDILSAAPFSLSFKELRLQQETQLITKQDADSSIVDKGISYLKDAKNTVSDLAGDVIDKAKSTISGLF